MAHRSDDQQRRKNLDSIRGVLVRLETMAEAHSAAAHGTGEQQDRDGRDGAGTGKVHPFRPDGRAPTGGPVAVRDAAANRDGRSNETPRNPDDMDSAGRFDIDSYAREQGRQWELSIGADAPTAAAPRATAPRTKPAGKGRALAGVVLASVAGILVCVAGLLAFDVLRLPSLSGPPGSDRSAIETATRTPAGTPASADNTPALRREASAPASALQLPSRNADAEAANASPAGEPKGDPAPPAAAEREFTVAVEIRLDPALIAGIADYYVTISGLPAKARLDGGRMVFPGSYVIEARDLSRLRLVLPGGGPQPVDVTVVVVARPGRVLAEMPARVGADAGIVDVRAPRTQTEGEAKGLVTRALQMIEHGDFGAARGLLEQAATAGDADAALVLATSFDPRFAAHFGGQGSTGDATTARRWYAFAAERGSREAADRLRQLGPE